MVFRKFITIKCLFIFFSFSFSAPVHCESVWPTLSDWKESFIESAKSPITWIPLAGAAVIYATNSDNSISNWASSCTPIFGSQNNAEKVSNQLQGALGFLTVGTLLLAPQKTREKWYIEKTKFFIVESAATATSSGVTEGLKYLTNRERPNNEDNLSFPSQHATQAFSLAFLSTRNIENFDLSKGQLIVWNIGVYALASGTGWARVEAKDHYPTDVLVGAAIGNFFTSLIYRAFVKKHKSNDNLIFSIVPEKHGASLNFGKTF